MKYVSEPLFSQKKSLGICVVQNCSRKCNKSRKICTKHKNLKFRNDNPEAYWHDVLRSNAKRRKIDFQITLEEFKKFCSRTNYIKLKGRSPNSYTIDRKISTIGYTYDNIQILTLSQNVKKMWVETKIRLGRYPSKEELDALISPVPIDSESIEDDSGDDYCPF